MLPSGQESNSKDKKQMKHIVCLLLSLSAMGCGTSFSNTRVGPNRFTVISHGHDEGPENYSLLLAKSYETCKSAGFKDYTVVSLAKDTRRVIMFIRCEDEKKSFNPSITSDEKKKDDNSLMTDLQNFYESAKRRLQEHTEETAK
jgi:hypothetical protein